MISVFFAQTLVYLNLTSYLLYKSKTGLGINVFLEVLFHSIYAWIVKQQIQQFL